MTGLNTNSGNSVPEAGGAKSSVARANCHELADVGKPFAPANSIRALILLVIYPLRSDILEVA